MLDHRLFRRVERPHLYLAEVKSGGSCRLNGPWTDPAADNVGRVLAAIGCYQDDQKGVAAAALYDRGHYRGSHVDASLVAIADYQNEQLAQSMPNAIQLVWNDILAFTFERLSFYHARKAHHPQWDGAGQAMYRLASGRRMDSDGFQMAVRLAFFGRRGPAGVSGLDDGS